MQQPGISIALVGARNKELAADNTFAVITTLTINEVKIISDHLAELELVA